MKNSRFSELHIILTLYPHGYHSTDRISTDYMFRKNRGSPISRLLSSTKNLPCTKKKIFFRVIIFNDNRDFRLKF